MSKAQPTLVSGLIDEFRTLYLKNPGVTNIDFGPTSSGKYTIEISSGVADPSDEGGLKYCTTHLFDPKTNTAEQLSSLVAEDVTVFVQRYSPKGTYKAMLKGTKAGMIIELYGRDGIVLRQLVPPTTHMAAIRKAPSFVTDPIVWSEDETRFMYVADDPKAQLNLFKLKELGIFRYRFEDLPGERIQGHTNPSVFIFDIPSKKLFQVAKPDETMNSRKVWVMPVFADRHGTSILCVQIEMCGVFEMAFFNNYPKRLAYLKGLETSKITKGGLLNILRVVPEEVKLPKVSSAPEEIVYFPRVSPDWTKFSYLFAEKAVMGNTCTFGFRVVYFDKLDQEPIVVSRPCLEENGVFHGIQGFNHTLHSYAWLGNDTILATTFFYNTVEVFALDINTKEVVQVSKKKKYLESESQYVSGNIDANHVLVRRDCVYRNNLFHVLYRDEAGAFKEIPLYNEFDPGYKLWEKTIELEGTQAVMYGKVDESIPPHERGAIFWVHGGPHVIWANVFNPFFQYFLHKGHNIINVNYGGSAGRGEEFSKQVNGHCPKVEVRDMAKFVNHIIETKQVHPDKVRWFGGSHGGCTGVFFLHDYPNLIKTMSIFNPPSDGLSLYHETSFPGTFRGVTLGKTNEIVNAARDTTPEEALAAKPASIFYKLGKHSTQVLLFGGMRDSMISMGSNRKLYKAARAFGNQWEYFEYPDEEHIFTSPNSCFDYFIKSAVLFHDQWSFN